MVICLYCKKNFNKDNEPYVKIGRRYAHASCEENRKNLNEPKIIPKTYLRKCLYCGGDIDIRDEEHTKVKTRYVHNSCYNKRSSDEDFINLIYELLRTRGIEYNYVKCEAQRKKYISTNGYTNEGIYKTLQYFYEVKNGAIDKSNGGIGIVPYIYEEAKKYYEQIEQRKKIIINNIQSKNIKDIDTIKILNKESSKKKTYIDLNSI